MRVLIIHQYYKTPEDGGGIRSYHIAKYLAEQGHTVNVVTAYNGRTYKREWIGEVEVHYLPIYYTNHLSFLSRVHAFWRYVVQTKRLIKRLAKADLHYVISTPLTTGLIAMWAKRKFKIPYIFEVGDIWPEAPIQLGVIKNGIIKDWAYALERKIYTQSNFIVALSSDIKNNIARKTDKPIEVITNLADTEYFKAVSSKDELKEKFNYNNKFVVSYTGTVGLANELEYLLDVAEDCLDLEQLQFVVMGSGARWDKITAQAVSRGLRNVDFYPAGNKDQAKEMLTLADAVYISFKKAPILSSGSPNKFFDGLAAGKFVIINFEGWVKKELEKSGCGFYHDPEKPVTFREQLEPLLNNSEALKAAQSKARKLAESDFSLSKQLPKLRGVLESAVRNHAE